MLREGCTPLYYTEDNTIKCHKNFTQHSYSLFYKLIADWENNEMAY